MGRYAYYYTQMAHKLGTLGATPKPHHAYLAYLITLTESRPPSYYETEGYSRRIGGFFRHATH